MSTSSPPGSIEEHFHAVSDRTLMKTMLTFLVLGLTLFEQEAFAKWRPLTRDGLIENADVIVIAKMITQESFLGDDFHNQKAHFELQETLKGTIDREFSILGSDRHICAAYVNFSTLKPGTYLLFLRKGKIEWLDANGPNSAIPIVDNQLDWFADNTSIERTQHLDLDTVVKHIQQTIDGG